MEKGIFMCLDHDDLLRLIHSTECSMEYLPYYLECNYLDVDCEWNYNVLSKLSDSDLFHLYMCLKYNKNPEVEKNLTAYEHIMEDDIN